MSSQGKVGGSGSLGGSVGGRGREGREGREGLLWSSSSSSSSHVQGVFACCRGRQVCRQVQGVWQVLLICMREKIPIYHLHYTTIHTRKVSVAAAVRRHPPCLPTHHHHHHHSHPPPTTTTTTTRPGWNGVRGGERERERIEEGWWEGRVGPKLHHSHLPLSSSSFLLLLLICML